ncbi:MAG: hypothetical protein HQL06_06975 [Nitrospirae bacterium]|nr:hypothetical protein [Nitrospirota bacterium]
MKELMIVLDTTDMNHPRARKCIEYLKKTDLSLAELVIVDNVYSDGFNRGACLEGFRRLAGERPIILLQDDVFIEDARWLTKLRDVTLKPDVLVAGCLHSYERSSDVFAGALVGYDGRVEPVTHIAEATAEPLRYLPCILSGVVFIAEPEKLGLEAANITDNGKTDLYQDGLYEADICMQAWAMNKRVAACLDLTVKRMLPHPSVLSKMVKDQPVDGDRFRLKWQVFIKDSLYAVQELKGLEKRLKEPSQPSPTPSHKERGTI